MADKGEAWKDYFRAACTQEGIIINGETILDTQGVDEKWQDNLRAACTPAGIKVVGSAQAKLYDELGQHTDGALTQKCATDNILDKQKKLIPGANINLDGDGNISAIDTTYSVFTGATSSAAGTSGLVPAPASGDQQKYLRADGTWNPVKDVYSTIQTPAPANNVGAIYIPRKKNDGTYIPEVGSDEHSSFFVAGAYFIGSKIGDGTVNILGKTDFNPGQIAIGIEAESKYINGISIGSQAKSGNYAQAIGLGASAINNAYSTAIGQYSNANNYNYMVALGAYSNASKVGSVALGCYSNTTRDYEVNVKYTESGNVHNRLIGGVADGVNNNDAATVGQLNNKVDKVTGKGLSTNDFTDTLKTKLDGIEEGAEVNDPDTVIDSAYVHTDNNFTNTLKSKLDGIEEGSEVNPDIDTALDASSTNPVENRIITNALNNKITVTDTDPGEGASLAANQFIAVYEA